MGRTAARIAVCLLALVPLCAAADPLSDDTNPDAGWGGSIFPAFFYTPETGFGGGAGIMLVQRVGAGAMRQQPNTLACFAIYTEKNQASISLDPEWRLSRGSWILRGEIGYEKYPQVVFGIGNNTPDSAEEAYTTEGGLVLAKILRRVAARIRGGLACQVGHTAIVAHEAGGFIAARRARGLERGTSVGCGLVAEWDSRERRFTPGRGGWYQLASLAHRSWLGSDFEFEQYRLDLRRYLPLGPRMVLALQALGRFVTGHHPVHYYPTLGDAMRGFVAGRFQDRAMLVAQAEWRFPLKGRFGGVAFAALGDVSDRFGSFARRSVKLAGGVGLRFMLSQKDRYNVRLDIGYSREGGEVYVQFDEAF
jgi:hypothetical protein